VVGSFDVLVSEPVSSGENATLQTQMITKKLVALKVERIGTSGEFFA
jgi:hypothetical protein